MIWNHEGSIIIMIKKGNKEKRAKKLMTLIKKPLPCIVQDGKSRTNVCLAPVFPLHPLYLAWHLQLVITTIVSKGVTLHDEVSHPYEPPHGKTNNLHRRKQRRRSASR